MNDGPQRVRMAQYGTKHGHAPGVLQVMVDSPDVAVVGVYEPDREWRRSLEASGEPPWSQVRWLDDKAEMLDDPTIVAISSEGVPEESLGHTEEIIAAGKHAFYDKPAGDDYPRFERLVALARERGLLIQLGYMFRKHDGFERIADLERSGFLGHVFYIRGQMSVNVTEEESKAAPQKAGLFFDLGCHMIDQVVWILGRPERVTSYLRHDAFGNPGYADNTLGVFEYDDAMAIVDIAGKGFGQLARRFEVNGTEGSVINGAVGASRYASAPPR